MLPVMQAGRLSRRIKSGFQFRLKLNAATIAALAVLALFLSLIPLSIFYSQQSRATYFLAENKVDSVLWQIYQLEREHGRLRMALRNALDAPATGGQQDLALRYDIFFSRYDVVKNGPTLASLHGVAAYQDAMVALDAFIKTADTVLGEIDTRPVAVQAISDLFRQTGRDEEPIRDLTNFVTRAVYKEIDERSQTMALQDRWILALAAVQWFILSAALTGFVVYVRRQRLTTLESIKLTRRLRHARLRAEDANRAKGAFLANMSHELRTPFQGLLGMLGLLAETRLSGAQQDYANTALSSARHLHGLLNDILDTSMIESGLMTLRPAPVALRDLVGEVHALMAVAAHEKNLAFNVEVAPELPLWIEADAGRLMQILLNLLSNAIKFTDAGAVALRLSTPSAAASGSPALMQITVEDSGIGMDRATLAHLFTRFHQADVSVQRRHGGSGLGLEISRNLARMMGGQIAVESRLGEGSVFTVTLPLHPSAALETVKSTPWPPAHRLHVLIAEDHPVNARYLGVLLRHMGHQFTVCVNGAQALEWVQREAFDALLMDLQMPVMDGISATRAIRQLKGAAAAIPIVMISADILSGARHAALDAGVNGFIAKPVNPDSLRQALARGRMAASPEPPEPPASRSPGEASASQSVLNVTVYQAFVALMPRETFDRQWRALFGPENHEITLITNALAAHDWPVARRLAHQLKGVCMLMGLTALTTTLTNIEQTAERAPAEALRALLKQLAQDVAATRQALGALKPASELMSACAVAVGE
jgi:two-component system, sensor histidine kinase